MATFQVGDKVLIVSELEDKSTLQEKTVTKVIGDHIECGSPEGAYYSAYCWPARVRPQLEAIMDERARLKKAYDESLTLVFELKNKITRGEI